MILKMFSVYDTKAAQYGQPFFAPTEATALRGFRTAIADKTHDFNRYAEDFQLYTVGSWDTDSAEVLADASQLRCIGYAHIIKAELNQLEMFEQQPASNIQELRSGVGTRPSRIQGGE